MSKKRQFVGTFKLAGVRWEVSRYWRGGEWRMCYAPRYGCDPIFSKTPLTVAELKEIVAMREARFRERMEKHRDQV